MKKARLSVFIAGAMFISALLAGCSPYRASSGRTFSLLICTENRDMEESLRDFAEDSGINLEIEYRSTLDAVSVLNSENCEFDGVWLSNSIWLYMLNGKQRITNAKSVSINPVVFAVKKSQAEKLGFTDRQVSMNDIVNAVRNGELTFLLPSVTQTNSGASAYLGFLYALAGSPEVLTNSHLQDADLQKNLTELFSGVERTSGSEDYLGEMFLEGSYDAMVNYEFEFISLNKKLVSEGKEPLYLIYPSDGVSLSDSPFAYIDKGDSEKAEMFAKLQNFLLSEKTQKEMAQTGRRTGYGGQNPYGSESVFNPDWGIDMKAYLSPVNYPSSEVIASALKLFQERLKKPSVTVFCLDMSGSMEGEGYYALMEAMKYILNPETAGTDYMQFNKNDIIYIMPFTNTVTKSQIFSGNGDEHAVLIKKLNALRANGGTDIYEPVIQALGILENYSNKEYTLSVVLMTDGQSNTFRLSDLEKKLNETKINAGIFSIMFGSASEDELLMIAKASRGRVFDGRSDLISAFKEIRGYN